MATATKSVHDVCVEAKEASRVLARAERAVKDAALLDLAERIDARVAELIEANAADLDAGREEGLNEALIDRLTLTEARVAGDGRGRARDRRARPTPSARSPRAGRSRTGSRCASSARRSA